MEKQAGFWLLTVQLLVALNSARAEVVSSSLKVGDDLDLRPPVSDNIISILWKHNGYLLAEWLMELGEVEYYGSFKGRTTLNTTTGHLTIKNMQVTDSGLYTVEVNNIDQDERYDVKVFQKQSKPEIWVRPASCSSNSSSCTLICKAPTEGAESVTYSWRKDDGEWRESEKERNITKAEDAHVKTFTCRVKTPVSEEESEHFNNPLQTVLPSVVLNSTQVEGVLSFLKVGGVLVLRPPKSGPFTNVLWKHNGYLVAEWTKEGGDLDYFGSFRGRTTLNSTTGHLTIKDLKVSDSGVYSVEVNNTVQDERYDVKVIQELSKPIIWVRPLSCSPHSTLCTMICDAPTKGAEPVTYSWRKDDGEWMESEKERNITKAEDAHVKTFTCRVKTPVSEEESEHLDNPLQAGLPSVEFNFTHAEGVLSLLNIGDDLNLRPPVSDNIISILWKHNGNLVAEWPMDSGEVEYYGSFRGRTTLNTTTGHLTIKNMQVTDSGLYTVEVNNIDQDERYDVEVSQKQSKPIIWVRPVSCSPDSTSCTMTCDAPTEDAESVTYSWREDDGEWKESEEILTITKAEDAHVKTFTCRVKTPVSKEESEHFNNPLHGRSRRGKET